MAISQVANAFVGAGNQTIGLSQIITATAASGNPAYLVLTALDRKEYTARASGATGSLSGNGHSLALTGTSGDGRGAGIVFTYQASTGRYYSSTYGYLDQLTYTSSGSFGDVTNLSLFGTDNLSLANAYAADAYSMMQMDASGYLGSATVVTQPAFSGSVPSQATPNSIASVANSFVGQAWNMEGCWILASTIAAEAGASLPVQSTAIGISGQSNGEWIVAYNGPAGQAGNWQSMVTKGEIIVMGNASGGGHVTTCVYGTGATALLVDNITYMNGFGQITNAANDGSASDVTIAAAHLASQEWAGVPASTVVIYELDTPAVTATVDSCKLAGGGSLALGSLFTASDPVNKAITKWQIYDTASGDTLVCGGTNYQDHSAGSALTTTSLASVSMLAGSSALTDMLDVRAYNGSYWGDWTSLAVAVSGSAGPTPPIVARQTGAQTWTGGKAVSLTLPAATFNDPQGQKLTYTATLANGQALPAWLSFNAAAETFSGTPPTTAQTLTIKVTATDSSGLSASETFAATVIGAPVMATPTPNQAWAEGKAFSLTLPAATFSDPQGQKLIYAATLANGQALPTWLSFNAATEMFSGTAPLAAQTLTIKVTATDSSGLSASETFSAAVAGVPVVKTATANQIWTGGKAISLALPANTFTDPQGQALTYTAMLVNGQALPTWLSFNAATDTFTGTAPLTAQTLTIKVTATDSSGLSASETFAATVIGAPIVTTATPNQAWAEGKAFSLTLLTNTFADPQGQALTYTATLANGQGLPGWLSFNAATGTFTGTAPSTAQTLTIKVTATDRSGLSASETFAATVAGAPVVRTATANQTWTGGKAISLALPANAFADPQGQTLIYSALLANGQALPSWLSFNAATGTFTGAAPLTAQTLAIKVTATDSSGLSASETFAATIIGAPVVTVLTASQTWAEGKVISLALLANTFVDPQGQGLTYMATLANGQALPSWLHFNAATGTFTGTAPSTAQTLSIRVTATDTSGLSAFETFSAAVFGAPALTAQTANQTWTEGKAISLALPKNSFADPQGQALAYTATLANGQALPGWLNFNATTGTFSGTAPSTAQTLTIKVTATDTSGLSASESFAASVTPPVITVSSQTPNQTWVDGQTVNFTLPANTFSDALGLKMTFLASQTSSPNVLSWLGFDSATDRFYGTVPATLSGTMALAVKASDALGNSATDIFAVTFVPSGTKTISATHAAFLGVAGSFDTAHITDLIPLHS